jgi:hypothetical protein
MVLLAVIGITVLVVMALVEASNLSRGPRRRGPMFRVPVLVFLGWRLATWLSGS